MRRRLRGRSRKNRKKKSKQDRGETTDVGDTKMEVCSEEIFWPGRYYSSDQVSVEDADRHGHLCPHLGLGSPAQGEWGAQ